MVRPDARSIVSLRPRLFVSGGGEWWPGPCESIHSRSKLIRFARATLAEAFLGGLEPAAGLSPVEEERTTPRWRAARSPPASFLINEGSPVDSLLEAEITGSLEHRFQDFLEDSPPSKRSFELTGLDSTHLSVLSNHETLWRKTLAQPALLSRVIVPSRRVMSTLSSSPPVCVRLESIMPQNWFYRICHEQSIQWIDWARQRHQVNRVYVQHDPMFPYTLIIGFAEGRLCQHLEGLIISLRGQIYIVERAGPRSYSSMSSSSNRSSASRRLTSASICMYQLHNYKPYEGLGLSNSLWTVVIGSVDNEAAVAAASTSMMTVFCEGEEEMEEAQDEDGYDGVVPCSASPPCSPNSPRSATTSASSQTRQPPSARIALATSLKDNEMIVNLPSFTREEMVNFLKMKKESLGTDYKRLRKLFLCFGTNIRYYTMDAGIRYARMKEYLATRVVRQEQYFLKKSFFNFQIGNRLLWLNGTWLPIEHFGWDDVTFRLYRFMHAGLIVDFISDSDLPAYHNQSAALTVFPEKVCAHTFHKDIIHHHEPIQITINLAHTETVTLKDYPVISTYVLAPVAGHSYQDLVDKEYIVFVHDENERRGANRYKSSGITLLYKHGAPSSPRRNEDLGEIEDLQRKFFLVSSDKDVSPVTHREYSSTSSIMVGVVADDDSSESPRASALSSTPDNCPVFTMSSEMIAAEIKSPPLVPSRRGSKGHAICFPPEAAIDFLTPPLHVKQPYSQSASLDLSAEGMLGIGSREQRSLLCGPLSPIIEQSTDTSSQATTEVSLIHLHFIPYWHSNNRSQLNLEAVLSKLFTIRNVTSCYIQHGNTFLRGPVDGGLRIGVGTIAKREDVWCLNVEVGVNADGAMTSDDDD